MAFLGGSKNYDWAVTHVFPVRSVSFFAAVVRRQLEAKLTLGDLGFLKPETKKQIPTFDVYADQWMKDYAGIECKASTASGYEGVLRLYLRPRFGSKFLTHIKRADVKAMINDLIMDGLSRSTIRNTVCVMRGIFNQAIEDDILESNPAARIGRFTRSATGTEVKGVSLTTREVQLLLEAAETVCPEYHALFLMAVRAGLRRGELVALQWGDIQFGKNDMDPNQFILVQAQLCSSRAHDDQEQEEQARGFVPRTQKGVT